MAYKNGTALGAQSAPEPDAGDCGRADRRVAGGDAGLPEFIVPDPAYPQRPGRRAGVAAGELCVQPREHDREPAAVRVGAVSDLYDRHLAGTGVGQL